MKVVWCMVMSQNGIVQPRLCLMIVWLYVLVNSRVLLTEEQFCLVSALVGESLTLSSQAVVPSTIHSSCSVSQSLTQQQLWNKL